MFHVIVSVAKQSSVMLHAKGYITLNCLVVLFLTMTTIVLHPLPSFAQEDITAEEEIAPDEADEIPVETKKIEKKNSEKKNEKAEEKKPEPAQEPNAVTLLALNKVTARVAEFTAPIGVVTRFGNLEVIARACKKSDPDKRPENTALLEIWELKPKGSPDRIFNGWMFSSSPALNALENPVYDITVKECVFKSVDEL